MTWAHLAGAFLLALGAGAGVGALARPAASPPVARPKSVESLLQAYDRGDAARVRDELVRAGPSSRYASPWREEVSFVESATAGDWGALLRLGHGGPSGAGAARALLHVADRHPDAAERSRALERMRAVHPDSWALAARERRGR